MSAKVDGQRVKRGSNEGVHNAKAGDLRVKRGNKKVGKPEIGDLEG